MAAPEETRTRPTRVVVVVATAAAATWALVTRFLASSPLWLDEALSVNIASLPVGDIPGALRHDGHPPLYYWLLHGWMDVVGDGDFAVRALSGIAGLAALPLMWLAGRRVGGTRTAWAAVLVLGVSPYAVRYSTETRMYAIVSLLVLVGHLLVRRALDDVAVGLPVLGALSLISGTLLLTQYWSAFLLGATMLVLVLFARRAGPAHRRVAVRVVVAIAAGGILFLPWLPSFLEQAAHTGTPWATAPRPTVVFDLTLRDYGGGEVAEAGLFAAALVVLMVIGAFGRGAPQGLVVDGRMAPQARGEFLVSVLTLVLGSIAGLLSNSTFASRYASVILPLVVLVAARGLALVPGRRGAYIVAAGVAALGLAGITSNITDDRTQAGDLALRIVGGAGPSDTVVACPDQLGPALRRALDAEGRPDLPVLAYPTLEDGRFVDWYDYEDRNDAADPEAIAAEVLARNGGNGRIWVVWNGAYRTFEGHCEELLNGIAARGRFRVVEPDGAGRYFEHAALVVFR